jgi:hypothetical protein
MSALFRLGKRTLPSGGAPREGASVALYGWRLPTGFATCELCNADVPLLRLLRNPLARRCRRCESSC